MVSMTADTLFLESNPVLLSTSSTSTEYSVLEYSIIPVQSCFSRSATSTMHPVLYIQEKSVNFEYEYMHRAICICASKRRRGVLPVSYASTCTTEPCMYDIYAYNYTVVLATWLYSE